MKKNVSLRGEAIRKVRELAREAINPLTIKNLLICLGLSTSIIFSSAGGLATREMFTNEVEAATQFSDDSSIRDYSREAVEYLVGIGSIKGYEDGTFKPSGTITRVEYLSMAMNAVDPDGTARAAILNEMKTKEEGGVTFYDMFRDATLLDDIADVWGGKADDILTIYNYIGYLSFEGESQEVNGRSGWLQPITRAEAAQMLVDCLEKLGGEELEIADNVESIIADFTTNMSPDSTSSHYNTVKGSAQMYAIEKLYSAGIVEGNEDGAYQPQYNLTREQAAQTIYRAVNKDKRSEVNIAPIEEEAPVENTTLYQSDADRRDAVEGDTFIDSNGTSYSVTAGVGGVLGEGQPIALDAGRTLTKVNEIIKDGTVSDGTVGRLGDTYYINPDTGEGHWGDEWDKMRMAYLPDLQGTEQNGDVTYRGLGNWLKFEFIGDDWSDIAPDWLF